MTDDPLERGLGWIESPPDERDWSLDALYAAAGAEPPAVLPAAYHVPAPLYPVVEQTVQCRSGVWHGQRPRRGAALGHTRHPRAAVEAA